MLKGTDEVKMYKGKLTSIRIMIRFTIYHYNGETKEIQKGMFYCIMYDSDTDMEEQ